MGLWSVVLDVLVLAGMGQHISRPPIAVKELIPIILTLATWGGAWTNMQVVCRCDNQVVVAALRSRTSRQRHIMHLLRCLTFLEARHDLTSEYISTLDNHLANDLSRDRLSCFLQKTTDPDLLPSQIPHTLLPLLLDPEADWTSQLWRRQFRDILTVD